MHQLSDRRRPYRLRSERNDEDRGSTKQSIAHAAGWDAGDRNMRKHGRVKWNDDDWNVAAETYSRVYGEDKNDEIQAH